MSGYDVYIRYLALKRHFTDEGYDFFRYHGKVNAKQSSYETRRDRYTFESLARRYGDEVGDFLLANFAEEGLKAPKLWVRDANEGRWVLWQKKIQSIRYHLREQLKSLPNGLDDALYVEPGAHPKLMRLYLSGKLSLETLVLLQEWKNFIPYWDRSIGTTDPLWKDVRVLMRKYAPFLAEKVNMDGIFDGLEDIA